MRNLFTYLRCGIWLGVGWLTLCTTYAQSAPSASDKKLLSWADPAVASSLSLQQTVSLKQFLGQLEQQHAIHFSYPEELVANKMVRPSAKNSVGEIELVLRQTLNPLAITFVKVKDVYILQEAKSQLAPLPQKKPDADELAKPTGLIKKVESLGNQLPAGTSKNEEQTIAGQVIDLSTDEGLPGVNVLVKGTTVGTVTDVDGNYRLTAPDDAETLVFSSVGYESEEVSINGRSTIDLALAPDIQSLSEIVVVGYGTQKRSDLTGAVGSTKAEEITAFPAANLNQALQGRVAGVNVTSTNGNPGSNPQVTIRGITSPFSNSAPLYVVDGFVGGVLPPPEDIASVEVLKDASAAAIYGSRGSNGVIIVTTKSGKAGEPVVEVNTSYSPQQVIRQLDLLNRSQFEDLVLEVDPNYNLIEDPSIDTDWQDEIFRTGSILNTQLSISGGSEDVKYFVSGSYFDQQGTIVNSNFDRFSLNSNLDFNASSWLSLSANLLYRRSTSSGVVTQERTGGPLFQGAVSSAYLFAPDLGIFNDDGTYTTARTGQGFNNPVAIANERINDATSDDAQMNLRANIEFTKWLDFTSTFGYSVNNRNRGRYIPSTLVAGEPGGVAQVDSRRNTNLISENYLTFQQKIGEAHDLKLIAGASYQDEVFTDNASGNENFITDNFGYWNLANGILITLPESRFRQAELFSVYGRLEYDYQSRYFITGTLRYDGSSRLSEGNKYELFPSVGLAWNLKNEAFLDGVSSIELFKLRASLGTTGNQNIGIYSTLPTLNTDIYSDENNNIVTALNPGQIPNTDLTWETSRQLNVGFDGDFWGGKLFLSADWYQTNTTNLLFAVPLNPLVGGSAQQNRNLGEIQNRGLELAIGTNNTFGDLRWSARFNINGNRNQVVSLPEGEDVFYTTVPDHINGLNSNTQSQVLREGEPIGVFFGFIYDGVYQESDDFVEGSGFEQEAGGERFRDIAGGRDDDNQVIFEPDGTLNSDDRTIIGDPNPDFTFGFDNTFSYKGFDLNIFFTGSQGGQILNFTRMELELLNGGTNATTAALDRWTPQNTNTDVPRASVNGRQARISTRFLEDASFIRLRNLLLGYNLPKSVLDRIGINRLRVYISAQNILTFTDYQGVDPEVAYRRGEGGRSQNLGMDYGSYPNSKSYTVGLNLAF
ncbi:SusC/RagA family TonB-linked outer membrane protein [Tunicatimonas pelagia]|uniref:SusC/RagA family TonB-linked outer membrane protein n=1 Tax=Tunicatimonas pelagia TaxID=931531 RepID=UPI0026663794|nr:TonB-dependent receptor [Tunicatimonas pelagia]WKN44976.1 TonB-dependent receptor [Tunicatimonas pelagia]